MSEDPVFCCPKCGCEKPPASIRYRESFLCSWRGYENYDEYLWWECAVCGYAARKPVELTNVSPSIASYSSLHPLHKTKPFSKEEYERLIEDENT